jgi:serine/threonine-protein kinase
VTNPHPSRYTKTIKLGKGGFGTVWRGYDHELLRDVALKFLNASIGSEHEKQLRREAQRAAKLEHAHIARVYDYAVIDDQSAIVMQLGGHGSLADQIGQTVLPVRVAIRHARDLCAALAYLRRQNTRHFDLKPANIVFDEEDNLLVTDFGLAESATNPSGEFRGTQGYAPPEAYGNELDFPADVYSAGIVIHEMLTGRHPYAYGSREQPAVVQLEYRILHEKPVAARVHRSDVSVEVEEFLLRMLHREPSKRPAAEEAERFFEEMHGRLAVQYATGEGTSMPHPPVSEERAEREGTGDAGASIPTRDVEKSPTPGCA